MSFKEPDKKKEKKLKMFGYHKIQKEIDMLQCYLYSPEKKLIAGLTYSPSSKSLATRFLMIWNNDQYALYYAWRKKMQDVCTNGTLTEQEFVEVSDL